MKKDLILWVSMTRKVLSLKQISGFEKIVARTKEEYWEKVHTFLDTGYRVQ
ncbi:hypothetical protein GCM10008910_27270 [Faecalicatena orotica]|uniref:hypothetical protein n=1 Tax=Faecalicatena orotica TaxID=1544 RepID=UPI0015E81D1A|nr:hypothetical protein [Faecalicatena orotica]